MAPAQCYYDDAHAVIIVPVLLTCSHPAAHWRGPVALLHPIAGTSGPLVEAELGEAGGT